MSTIEEQIAIWNNEADGDIDQEMFIEDLIDEHKALKSKVENMAMLMRLMLSERHVNRQAKQWLVENKLAVPVKNTVRLNPVVTDDTDE